MTVLIIGLILFLGIHSVRIVAPGWRDARIKAMGEGPWKGIYTLISIAGLVLLVWGYGLARPESDFVYEPPALVKHIVALLMLLALIIFMVSQLPSGKMKPALKHPMLVSIMIWAVAHLAVNGDIASILLFGAFLLWAFVNRISVGKRDAPLPVEGPVMWDIAAIVSGVIVYLLFVWQLHAWLFGVLPFG